MNLKNRANFRRSRLIEPQPLTDKKPYFQLVCLRCQSNCSKQFHHTCEITLENDLPLRGKEPLTCREKTKNEVDTTSYTSLCWLSKNFNKIIWSLVQKSQNCSCNWEVIMTKFMIPNDIFWHYAYCMTFRSSKVHSR